MRFLSILCAACLIVAPLAAQTPAQAPAPAAKPAPAPAPAAPAAAAKPAPTAEAELSQFQCGNPARQTCGQMKSCDEAQAYYWVCGMTSLDGSRPGTANYGIPCTSSVCSGKKALPLARK